MSHSHTHHNSGFFHGDHGHTHSQGHLSSSGVHCEGHSHPHINTSVHGRDFNAENNRRHFNEEAATYDEKAGAIALTKTQCEFLREMVPFNKELTTVMDYACGTGLVSRELRPFAKSIIGIDISQGMVDQYNKWANEQDVPPHQMKAVCTELQGQEGELDGCKFDVIVCSMAYHHFSSIETVTRILAHFLKPGGSLMVMDMMKPENISDNVLPPDHARTIVPHTHAFSEEDMRLVFKSADLEDFTFRKTGSMTLGERDTHFFIAKGTKQ